MDHRVSKDMISQGMSVTGEKKTEDLGGSQYGSAATPNSLMDAYSSMYKKEVKEDAKWGYDSKGRSLNPKDKKKVKEDVEQVDEIVISGTLAALAAKGAMAAKGVAGAAKAAGVASKVGKVANVANKVSAVSDVAGALTGGGQPKKKQADMQPNVGTVAAGHELDGDVLKELQDSGLFSEEELKSITEISSGKLLDAAKASEVARGKKAVAGDKSGAAKEVVRSKKFYDASVSKRKEGM